MVKAPEPFLFDDSRQILDSRIALRSSNKRQHLWRLSNEFPSCKVGTTSSEGGSGRRRDAPERSRDCLFLQSSRRRHRGSLYAFTEGIVPPRHEHRNTSIIGKMRRSISSKSSLKSNAAARSSKAPPGTFALLPKGLPHRFQNFSDKPGGFCACSLLVQSRNSLST